MRRPTPTPPAIWKRECCCPLKAASSENAGAGGDGCARLICGARNEAVPSLFPQVLGILKSLLGKPKRHRNFSIDMADRRGQNPAHLPKCDFRSAALAEVPPRFCIKDLGKGHQVLSYQCRGGICV